MAEEIINELVEMNNLLIIISILLGCQTMSAQEMKDVFSAMPDSVLPTLTRNNRLDMIDFVTSGMKAEVKDVFDETVTLDTLTTDYLHLTLSDALMVEMKLLPSSNVLSDSTKKVVCVVMTYGRKPFESRVQMFTSNWNPQPLPAYISDGKVARLSPSDTTLSLQKVELVEYREEGEEKSAKDEEIPLMILKWNGNTFNKD